MSELSIPDGDIRIAAYDTSLIKRMSEWPTLPKRYAGKPADIHAAIVAGHELGIEPMEAINSLYLVNGQISMSGKLMSALVHRAGHELRVEIAADRSTVTAHRRDPYTKELHPVGSIMFTQEDAVRAGLADKDTYKAYPTVMLTWRAISQACRIYFADVLSGIAYVPEEVGIEAPIEAIPMDEIAEVEVVDDSAAEVELENQVADVAEALDADVVS